MWALLFAVVTIPDTYPTPQPIYSFRGHDEKIVILFNLNKDNYIDKWVMRTDISDEIFKQWYISKVGLYRIYYYNSVPYQEFELMHLSNLDAKQYDLSLVYAANRPPFHIGVWHQHIKPVQAFAMVELTTKGGGKINMDDLKKLDKKYFRKHVQVTDITQTPDGQTYIKDHLWDGLE